MHNIKGIDYDKMRRRVMKKVGEAVAKLYDFAPVTASVSEEEVPSIFKVVATFSTIGSSVNKESLFHALATATGHKASPIENSFRQIPGTNAYVGFVSKNGEVRPYETAAVEKMKVMASNLLMDDEDHSLWEVRSNDTAKFLVRHQEDDLNDLLALASVKITNRDFNVPVLSSLGFADARVNECAVYVNPNTVSVGYGMVVASEDNSIRVVDLETKETASINNDFIVELASFSLDEIKGQFKEVAAPEAESVLGMEEYWKQVLGYDAAYWAEFKKILDSRATV